MSELTNEDRANMAMTGVQAFSDEAGLDPLIELDTAVGDLVCDLMHLCDMNGLDFQHILERAKGHHSEEVGEEGAASTSSDDSNYTEILQHRIKWWLREDDAPGELDECSVEHIEKLIKEGYHSGELCVHGNDGNTEYRGWW